VLLNKKLFKFAILFCEKKEKCAKVLLIAYNLISVVQKSHSRMSIELDFKQDIGMKFFFWIGGCTFFLLFPLFNKKLAGMNESIRKNRLKIAFS